MALSDHEPTNSTRGPKCPIAVLFAQIPEADAKVVESWIDNRAHFGTAVAVSINNALTAKDLVADVAEITPEAVNRHRKRRDGGDHCKCP